MCMYKEIKKTAVWSKFIQLLRASTKKNGISTFTGVMVYF